MRVAIFGTLVSAFLALCGAGVPAVVGAVSAVGLGFLTERWVVLPLLVLSLGFALWGLGVGTARHGLQAVLVLGWIGAALMLAGTAFQPFAYAGAVIMIGASIWNARALR